MKHAHPIPFETWVAYWADDLEGDEVVAVEDHAFGCAECTAESERVARITETIRAAIPPVVSQRTVDVLRARGVVVEDLPRLPDDHSIAHFREPTQILLHRLGGLELGRAVRVNVTVRTSSGQVLSELFDTPFERDTGEVLIACQRHFAAFPRDVEIEVDAFDEASANKRVKYIVPHEFELSPAPRS